METTDDTKPEGGVPETARPAATEPAYGEGYSVLASARYGLLFALLVLIVMLIAIIFMSTRGGG